MIHTVAPVRVRYVETDRMGLVHHGNYFAWFELARIHMLDEIGLPYAEIEAEGYLIPVLEATARYLRGAAFDDRLEVHLFMRDKPRARFRFDYEVRRGEESVATGSTLHAFMSPDGRGLRPPEHFLRRLEAAWADA